MLKNNSDIIIKFVDRWSGIIIMYKADFLSEGYKQLCSPQFYESTDTDLTGDKKVNTQNM